MRRRRLLATLVATSIAGCSAPTGGEDNSGATPTDPSPGATPTDAGPPLAERGFPSTICETAPMEDPGIYAIVEPATAPDWYSFDIPDKYGTLDDESVVIGVERDGAVRAYPLSIVWYHEAVNDILGGPLLVTYCPICRSAMVARRVVDGDPTIFEATGELWVPPAVQARASETENRTFGVDPDNATRAEIRNSGNLVLVDRATGSYWSQLLAQAICGPLEGERLEPVPAWVGTWGAWRNQYPGTAVLLPPPHSGII